MIPLTEAMQFALSMTGVMLSFVMFIHLTFNPYWKTFYGNMLWGAVWLVLFGGNTHNAVVAIQQMMGG